MKKKIIPLFEVPPCVRIEVALRGGLEMDSFPPIPSPRGGGKILTYRGLRTVFYG